MIGRFLEAAHKHERALAFARFVWHRFRDDKCFEAAGALSYTTIFALVPLTTAALGIIAAFPVFGEWSNRLTDFVFANFVPSAGKVVQQQLTQFAYDANKLTSIGMAALIASALMMMSSVEHTFNRIWRAPARRRRLARFLMYWTALTLSPILLAAGLALSSYLFSMPLLYGAEGVPRLSERLLALLPMAVTWLGLTLAYIVVPNSPGRFRHAAAGGIIATLLFEASKYGFAAYLSRANFDQVYGALAVIPIFLVWIYVSWVVVLLGASLAASLSAFRFQPAALRVPVGLEFPALLRCVRDLAIAARAGQPMTRAQLAAAEAGLTDTQLDRFLTQLHQAQLIQRTETGAFAWLRDPAQVPVRELFEAGGYRWPTDDELQRLRRSDVHSTRAVLAWLDAAAVAVAPVLAISVGALIDESETARARSVDTQSRAAPP